MKRFAPIVAAAGVVLLAGCVAPTPAATETAESDTLSGTVTILAAASLTESLDQLAAAFEAAHPQVDVVLSYGGSSALAEQIVSGSPADVFFSANEATMKTVTDAGLTVEPTVLLTNVLEIAVPAGNPGGVTGLADFADADLTIALCDPAVPCGSAAQRLFAATGITPSPDTLEEDVKAALAKVALGEVDAALVYVTDVRAAVAEVEGIEVPEAGQAINRCPISLLVDAPNPTAARAFLDFVSSPDGIRVFTDAGFGAP
jgi:molybdate transport system substrate-binding protein